jgi:predicted Zn finger-like uncharacterized protein
MRVGPDVVIACEHCSTRFQLDDARVPATGVRVRCSRCKHAFFVAPPGGTEEGVHAAAAAAVSGESGAPPPAEDLHAQAPESGRRAEGEAEEDWQFNLPEKGEEANAARAARAKAAAAPLPERSPPASETPAPQEAALEPDGSETYSGSEQDLRDQLFGDSDGPLGADPGVGASPEPAGPDQSSAPPGDDGIGTGHSLGSTGGDLGHDPSFGVADEGAGSDQPFGAPDENLGLDENEAAAPEAAPKVAAGPASLADLGNPEEWDFVGDAPLPEPRTSESRPPDSRAPETHAERAPGAAEMPEVAPLRVALQLSERPRWVPWAETAGWLVCAALVVAGVLAMWSTPAELAGRRSAPVGIGPLRLENLRASVVENVHAGPVWVFRGSLSNPQSDAAKAGAAPRLQLLDARGEVVGAAWFGREATDVVLREHEPNETVPRSGAAARDLGRRSFAAGERLELAAVVERLPPGAVTWRVEPEAVALAPTGASGWTLPALPSSPE